MSAVPSLDVLALAAEMEGGNPPFLLDVREMREAEICRIEGATFIPMTQIPQRINDIPRDRPVVVHCHHGGRSARVVHYLLGQGFTDIRNLEGGIDQWAAMVDPEMPRY